VTALELGRHLYLLLAALGLNVCLGYAGQPVLGQGAFVVVGSYGVALLTARAQWPLGVAVLASAGAVALLGWAVGHGAARLRGPFLALATWGAAWLALSIVVAFPGIFGGAQGIVRAAPAHLVSPALGLDWALTPRWHVALAAVCCAAVGGWTWSVGRGAVGLDLAALRASPVVADSLGVRTAALRRGTLAVAAGVGAVAGAGSTLLQGVVSPADASPLVSIQLFAAVLIGGSARAWGPAVGVAVLAGLPTVAEALATATGLDVARWRGLLTALLLVGVLALRSTLPARRPRVLLSISRRQGEIQSRTPAKTGAAGVERVEPATLRAAGLARSFGAVRAVDGVDLEVRGGEVHALVGPNGSGKSTLLRLLSGALAVDAGTVSIDDHDVTGTSQADRVRRGIARTFQRTVLFPRLPAGQQVLVGTGAARTVHPLRSLFGTPTARRADVAASHRAAAAASASGLVAEAFDAPAEQLPFGDQRLLQLARAVATGARVLLLDEPAAGMSAAERQRLSTALRALAESGRAVLLVEHDMRLVAALADRITVLAEGRVLVTGPPGEVLAHPAVRAAYLGIDVA